MKLLYPKFKQHDELLLDTELIDQIHDAVICTDLNGIINVWNKGAERQFGYTAEEIIGKPIYILYPEEKHSISSQKVVDLLKDEHSIEYETQMKHKSGETFYVHSSLSDITDEKGETIGIISYTINITERRLAENELEKYRNQLESLVKERTQELELTQASLIRKNRNLNVLSKCNQVLVHETDEQQLLNDICRIIVETGKYRLAWVGYAENDEHKTIRPVAQQGYEEGYLEELNLTWEDSERGHGPSGTAVRTGQPSIAKNITTDPNFKPWREAAIKRGYTSVAGFPLLENDQAFGAITIYAPEADAFDDAEIEILTELANNLAYGIQARRMRNELLQKERLAVLGQLIATVSHELRNPLGTIRTSLYTIKNKANNHNIDVDKPIQRIERNIVRCDNIIGELLDYTRTRDLVLQLTNIDAWLASELDEYAFPDEVTVTRKLNADVKVKIEQERFHRCLVNIFSNACQAMEKNAESSNQHITVETNVKNDKLNIYITDSGTGISSDELTKIFEPLYSTKTYGIGLGIPIIQQIMELHHGNVEITSEPGQGTTVRLWLPLPFNSK